MSPGNSGRWACGMAPFSSSTPPTGPCGRSRRVDYQENDHCCQRFALLDDWLRPAGLMSEGPVGKAHCRLMRSRDVVAVAGAQLARDPTWFLHARGSDCEECERAWRSLPG